MKSWYAKINSKRVGVFMKKIFTLLMMVFIGVMPVKAVCNYTDKAAANKKAANVKLDYEVVEDKPEFDS